jgi:hypothetical protein
VSAALSFLEYYHRESDEFLDHNITGNVTWVTHYISMNKRQSQEWHHTHCSEGVAQNLKQINSIAKIMASIFGTGKAFF